MAAVGQYIYNFLSSAMSGTSLNESPASAYEPSVSDVVAVRDALHSKIKTKLPLELIDSILNLAEYWPHTTTVTSGPRTARGNSVLEDMFILRSFPLGFIPDTDDLDHQMLPEDYEKYASHDTMRPEPWPETRDFPRNATDEVFKRWVNKSLARVEYPCRKIVFTLKSRDQGMGGGPGHRGTYNGAYSWFEAGLEKVTAMNETTLLKASDVAPLPQFRLSLPSDPANPALDGSTEPSLAPVCSLRTISPPTTTTYELRQRGRWRLDESQNPHQFHHPLLPSPERIQSNVVATRQIKKHVVTWSYNDHTPHESPEGDALEAMGRGRASANGEYVRNLKVGDVITVWAKARFPAWANFVEEVKMDVYFAV